MNFQILLHKSGIWIEVVADILRLILFSIKINGVTKLETFYVSPFNPGTI